MASLSSPMASNAAAFLGWSILPDFLTGHLQNFYYALTIRAGDPRPQPGTPRFNQHRQRVHIVVLLAYLAYTLYEAHWEVRRDGDFYSLLGLPHDVDDRTLQTRFRRLTLLYHPDKVTSEEQRPAAEARYMMLQIARDTLLDPAKRFAYDRFGPSSLQWKHCITVGDFVSTGLSVTYPWYVGSSLVLVVMNYLGFLNWGVYWRYLATAVLAAFELHTLTRPDRPSFVLIPNLLFKMAPSTSLLAAYTFEPYLPFQILQMARKAIVTLFIALSRLGPLLDQTAAPGTAPSGMSDDQKLARQLQRLEQIIAMNGAESTRLLALELVPFKSGDEPGTSSTQEPGMAELRDQVKEWLVNNTLRSDKQVRDAVQNVLDKRKRLAEGGEVVG